MGLMVALRSLLVMEVRMLDLHKSKLEENALRSGVAQIVVERKRIVSFLRPRCSVGK